jgi:hypothetical protein
MPSVRRWLAVLVLSTFTLYEAAGVVLWAEMSHAMSGCFVVFTLTVAAAAVGVVRKAFWGRALGLGIGIAGLLDVVSFHLQGVSDCGVMMFALMPAALLLLLSGPSMAEHFGQAPGSKLWLRDDWRVRMLGTAIMAAVPMVAGLLRHAASGAWWVGADDRAIAIGSALVISVGAIAALGRRTAGLLVMFAGACAASGLAFESMFRLRDPLSGGYSYLDGFLVQMSLTSILPSIVAIFVATLAFAPAMWRFMRRQEG